MSKKVNKKLLSQDDVAEEIKNYEETASEFNKDALSLENTQKELDEGKNLSVYGIKVKPRSKKGGKKKTRRMKLKKSKKSRKSRKSRKSKK